MTSFQTQVQSSAKRRPSAATVPSAAFAKPTRPKAVGGGGHTTAPRSDLKILRKHTQDFLHHLHLANSKLARETRRMELEPFDVALAGGERERMLESERRTAQQELAMFMASLDGVEGFDKSVGDIGVGGNNTIVEIGARTAATVSATATEAPAKTQSSPTFTNDLRAQISTLYEQRKQTQRSVSPSRLEHERKEAARRSDNISPKRVRVGKFGLHSAEIPRHDNATPSHLLTRDDAYFHELESFRERHPELFFDASALHRATKSGEDQHASMVRRTEEMVEELDAMTVPLDAGVRTEALVRGQYLRREGSYTGGYFRVNERYYPTKERNPFAEKAVADQVLDEDDLNDEEQSPVKVSIPHRVLQTSRKVYKPHTRVNYDPGHSMNVNEHLHQGYAPLHRGQIPRKLKSTGGDPDNMSFKREVRRTKNSAAFDVILK